MDNTFIDPKYEAINNFTYFLKHPITTIFAPIGALLSYAVVPAQDFNPRYASIKSENGFKANYAIEERERESIDKENRKVVLYLVGNGQSFETFHKDSKKISDHFNADVAFMAHPKASNKNAGIDCGVTMIRKLIADGYKPENITILGHSIGGAFATEIVSEVKKRKVLPEGQKLGGLVAHKTLSYLSNVVTSLMIRDNQSRPKYEKAYNFNGGLEYYNIDRYGGEISDRQGVGYKILNSIIGAILWVSGWNLNPAKILKNESLPINDLQIIQAHDDEIISNTNALGQYKNQILRKNNLSNLAVVASGHNEGLEVEKADTNKWVEGVKPPSNSKSPDGQAK